MDPLLAAPLPVAAGGARMVLNWRCIGMRAGRRAHTRRQGVGGTRQCVVMWWCAALRCIMHTARYTLDVDLDTRAGGASKQCVSSFKPCRDDRVYMSR